MDAHEKEKRSESIIERSERAAIAPDQGESLGLLLAGNAPGEQRQESRRSQGRPLSSHNRLIVLLVPCNQYHPPFHEALVTAVN